MEVKKMSKTANDFVNTYNGKVIDFDGAYGAQCVDGFRVFCNWAFGTSFPTGNGWADGYWYNRAKYTQWFEIVTNKQFQNGDWIIWARGSKSHPSSHIAMYFNGKEFGENQGGNRGFCLKDTNFADALGALRWKGFPKPVVKPAGKPNTASAKNTKVAYELHSQYARKYKTTVNLRLRDGWTTKDRIIVVMPAGSTFECFGYHTRDWLYGIYTYKGVRYTGFAYKGYLK